MSGKTDPADSPLLDADQLQMLIEAGASESAELLRELLDMFEEESIHKIADIKARRAEGNFEALGQSAHALAGSSANVGAREVWKLAKEIENLCKNGQGEQAMSRIEPLEDVYLRSMRDLKEVCNNLQD